MTDQPVTQRQLLEQNTELTRLVYETVGELTQKMNDGFADLREKLAHLEGEEAGEAALLTTQSTKAGIATSRWVRWSIGLSSALGIFNLIHGIK